MENREAINILQRARFGEFPYSVLTIDALDLAIAALEKQEQAENEWCPDCKEYDKENHCCHRFTKVIRQTVEECKREYANEGWIPVTERLPEEDKDVLVTVHFLGLKQTHPNGWNDHIKPSFYVDIAKHYSGEWCSASDEYKVARSRHIVTAWRPLPEAYMEEEA